MGEESRSKVLSKSFDCDLNQDIVCIRNLTCRFPKTDSSDSGDGKYKAFQPGSPEYGEVEFTGFGHPDTFGSIKDWVKANYNGDGNVTRKDITINIREHQGANPVRTFNLIGTYPKHFTYVDVAPTGNASALVRWTLLVRVQQLNMA
jgi:hypothetical protein